MTNKNNSSKYDWKFWYVLPLYPYKKRKTICKEIVEDTIWSFEQLQGILYAVVPIRMTVVKLKKGGLLVYSAIAPTPECIGLVNQLEARHGKVKYIIHPTSSGLEHKVFVGPFARHFPDAQVFVIPNQWSFPFNLPLSWLGFPLNRTYELSEDASKIPFADEFDYQILNMDLSKGYFGELALYHWRSQTLLLTDTIISIPEKPPEILQENPYPLLFHARENSLDKIADNQENRLKGWKRICLFACYFRPSAVKPIGISKLLLESIQSPDKSRQAYFGLFPFRWKSDWEKSFDILRGDSRPFVAPILQALILPQNPDKVIRWANEVAKWNFKKIISCHFQAPIKVDSHQFRQAFSFLEKTPEIHWFPESDLEFIQTLEKQLVKFKIATPQKEKI